MAFQILQLASGTVSPLGCGDGSAAWSVYSGSVTTPPFGLFIPATALPNYQPGTNYVRFVQTLGASGPATNGNLVVDVISNAPNSAGAAGSVDASYTAPGVPVAIVYTIAGGVLT